MGILFGPDFRVRDAHIPQVFQHLFPGRPALQVLVDFHRLGDLVPDGFQGVEAGHGVLHDHGDLVAPDLEPVLFLFQGRQPDRLAVVGAEIVDGALGDGAVGVQQAHEGLGEHRFARAALAHDGQHFALADVQVNAPDGVEHPAPEVEADVEVPGRENGGLVFHNQISPPLLQMVLGVGGVREGVADQVERSTDRPRPM